MFACCRLVWGLGIFLLIILAACTLAGLKTARPIRTIPVHFRQAFICKSVFFFLTGVAPTQRKYWRGVSRVLISYLQLSVGLV